MENSSSEIFTHQMWLLTFSFSSEKYTGHSACRQNLQDGSGMSWVLGLMNKVLNKKKGAENPS